MKLRGIFSVALAGLLGWTAQTVPAWADTYGAIASSEQNFFYEWSVDQGSADGANQRALTSCAQKGDDCKVVASFSNSCAALAVGGNHRFAASQSGTRQQAESDAMNACRINGGIRCDIKVAFCANAPGLNAKPGLWKLTNQNVSGGQTQPGSTSTRCFKPGDNPAYNWIALLDETASDATCKLAYVHDSSNSIQWKFACSGQAPRTREGSIKFDSPGHYTGTVATKAGESDG